MPAKRKIVRDGQDSPYSKRSRRTKPNQTEIAESILDIIRSHQDKDGRCVASTFIKVPSKRQNPEYHELVQEPIDLTRINQRLKMDEYRDIESLTADIDLLINNTKKFYDENSQEYKDSTALWELYLDTKMNSLSSTVPEISVATQQQETGNEELCSKMDEIYNSLLAEVDDEGQGLSDMFLFLPNEDEYPDYYETIKEAIDLTMIGQRIRSRVYKSLQDLEKDILLLIKNAKSYNEPSSKIYSNAVALKKAFREKMQESEKGPTVENSGVKTSARLKQRNSKFDTDTSLKRQDAVDFSEPMVRSSRSQPLLEASITSTLKGREGLQAKLYNEVVNYRTTVGHSISDAFVRLPNKHHYPAYYEEIENPISLKTIRRFILAKKYESITDLTEELHLLFKNAMQYNKESSQIYKNADTLQKFMHSKLEAYKKQESELVVSEEESESAEERDDDEEEEDDEEEVEDSGEEEATAEEKKKRRRRSDFGAIRKGRGQVQKERLKSFQELFSDRLRLLYNTVLEAKDEDRNMIELFMEKPSRKDYPDYYKLILEPIDMKMIEKKIRQDKFPTVAALIEDFNLMFNNAGHYNEPGSQVYQDANRLREILMAKQDELSPLLVADTTMSTSSKTDPSKQKSMNPLIQNMEAVYQRLRSYQDVSGREICEIFNKLPSKQELPDYYQVIKKPVDMDRILQKIQGNSYASMNEFMADIVLMFENACAYNEPGSVIYKDALILQKLAVDTCGEVMGSGVVPDVQKFLQEMLTSLFVSVMNHQDEDGRCYSDSLTLSPASKNDTAKTESSTTDNQAPDPENKTENKLSLEAIRRNLHARRYRRLDVFQEQMFQIFENARNRNRTDSEVYEDAVELQRFFIKIRDELCKNGEILMSPALTFTLKRLQLELDVEKQEKLPGETQEDEKVKEEGKEMREEVQRSTSSEGMDYQGITYQAGDFVYVEDSEATNADHPPHIVCIEKLYQGEEGEQRMYGVWFFRPQATYHLASRKFLLKEVFKSDYYNTVPVSKIRGKCFVMMAKDYFKLKPVGYSEDDVYVCVSRYSSRQKSFKRIKLLNLPANNTKIMSREKQLVPVRVSSVYSDDRKDDMADKASALGPLVTDDVPWPTNIIDVERESIENVAENQTQAEQNFYLQYVTNRLCLKVGDCVYASQPGTDQRLKIARIESIWTDVNNMAWFQGSWFAQPVEIEHEPTRMFYKNEVFLLSFNSPGEEATTATREATPLSWVVGRCAVLSVREMAQCRPTEIPEQHIHVCESRYLSQEKVIKKIKGALKKPSATHKKYQRQKKWYFWSIKIKQVKEEFRVVDDEVYYFKRPLNIQKEISPQLAAAVRQELHDREEEMKREIEENRRKTMQMQPNAGVIVQQSYQHPIQPGDPHFMGHQYTHYQQPIQQQQYVVQHGTQQQYIVQSNPQQQVHQGIPMQTYTHHQYTTGTPYSVQPQLQMQVHQGISPGMAVQHTQQPQMHHVYPGVQVQHVYAGQTNMPQIVQSPVPSVVRQTETPVDRVATPNSSSSGTPTAPKKKGRGGHSTGYILFASQCHPKMRAENPDMPFGDISKLVGEEWRKQTDEKKREYEEKARELTAKAEAEGRPLQGKKKKKQQMRREMEEAQQQQQQQHQQQHQHPPPQPHVVMQQPPVSGQVVMSQSHYAQPTHFHPQAFQQQQQQPGIVTTPQQQVVTPSHSLAYNAAQAQQIISTPAGPLAAQPVGQQQYISPGQTYIGVNQPSAVVQGASQSAGLRRGPLFVRPPSKVQRVLHSEAYLRYIESLEKGNRTISNWERTVAVEEKDVQLTQEDAKKLPGHWLANGTGKHETIKSALWSLRDLMLKDALAIKNHL